MLLLNEDNPYKRVSLLRILLCELIYGRKQLKGKHFFHVSSPGPALTTF